MKMFKVFRNGFMVLCCLLFVRATAQDKKSSSKNISVGEQVPDLLFDQVINYRQDQIRFSDFKGKWIILDFWGTFCAPCVANFPKLDSLQQEFSEQLQVILINSKNTTDTRQKALDFFKNRRSDNGEKFIMPSAVMDTVADLYFEHKIIPHLVVISPERKLVAITTSEEVNRINIKNLLSGQEQKFYSKIDLSYDTEDPNYMNDIGVRPLFVSKFFGHKDGLTGPTLFVDTKGTKVYKVASINATLATMYTNALEINAENVVFETPTPERFADQYDSAWLKKHRFSYELVMKDGVSRDSALAYMVKDLNRFFKLSYRFEKRITDVYILKANARIKSSYSKGEAPWNNVFENNQLPKKFINHNLNNVAEYLNKKLKNKVLNESNEDHQLDLTLPAGNLENIEELKSVLKKQGIDMTLEKRELEFFILTDNDWKKN